MAWLRPTSFFERLRVPRWVLLVFCLWVPSSLLQTAHTWQLLHHAASPVSPQHHEAHHAAGHFHAAGHLHDAGHNHEPDADTDHHREHHAEHDQNSQHQALLSGFKWRPAPQHSLFVPPVAVLMNTLIPLAPRETHPFGRDGPQAESPPSQHLCLPLAGRSPPVV